jgi:hypothetical protein
MSPRRLSGFHTHMSHTYLIYGYLFNTPTHLLVTQDSRHFVHLKILDQLSIRILKYQDAYFIPMKIAYYLESSRLLKHRNYTSSNSYLQCCHGK